MKEIEWLYGLKKFGIKPGLERIQEVMDLLGNPEKSYRVIHVTGTNGKGSTSAMIANVLKEAGYKVGMFSSPHPSKIQ
jgi:dihydrofolate synthase/folylpolyglutamate synthase